MRGPAVGVVLFSWFGIRANGQPSGQYCSAWTPTDGRANWDGSRRWYRTHLSMIEDAGFDFAFVQTPGRFADNVRRCLRVLRSGGQLAGAPYLAMETYGRPFDFTAEADRAHFLEVTMTWLRAFDALEHRWQEVQGRRLVGLWHVPGPNGPNRTIPAGMLEDLRARARAELGCELFITAHEEWRHAGVDQVDFLFNGRPGPDGVLQPFQRAETPEGAPARGADLLPGFYHSLERQEYWLPRRSGDSYRAAWGEVLRLRADLDLVLVESWNEMHEGSQICPCHPHVHAGEFASVPIHAGDLPKDEAMRRPHVGVPRSDRWGDTADLYLNISRRMIRRLRVTAAG